jgi:hypothetical protein
MCLECNDQKFCSGEKSFTLTSFMRLLYEQMFVGRAGRTWTAAVPFPAGTPARNDGAGIRASLPCIWAFHICTNRIDR